MESWLQGVGWDDCARRAAQLDHDALPHRAVRRLAASLAVMSLQEVSKLMASRVLQCLPRGVQPLGEESNPILDEGIVGDSTLNFAVRECDPRLRQVAAVLGVEFVNQFNELGLHHEH